MDGAKALPVRERSASRRPRRRRSRRGIRESISWLVRGRGDKNGRDEKREGGREGGRWKLQNSLRRERPRGVGEREKSPPFLVTMEENYDGTM